MTLRPSRLALLIMLLVWTTGGCSTTTPEPSAGSANTSAASASTPAPEAPEAPASPTPAAAPDGFRFIDPYRLKADSEAPYAVLFETREAMAEATFATALMGQNYQAPDFASEYVVGVGLPASPGGTEMKVQGVSVEGDTLTIACTIKQAEEPTSFTVKPTHLLGVPKRDDVRTIVVTMDGQEIAKLAIP